MLAHKKIFILSLVASFLGLAVQVLIPAVMAQAIDKGLKKHGDLTYYVGIIVALGCVRFVLNYTSRLYMLKTAYRIEYDLRNIMYEHLSRMSFSFYDRVQSGQLISRGNSDIRQVQMYLAMAPIVFVQCSVAVLAFILMLTINVPLAFVAMSTMPFVFIVAVRMRRYMFPVSWLAQARLADVATVVDENINGVRVVKSFAAEENQLNKLTAASKKAEWANVKDADIRAHWAPLIENLPRLGQALVLLYGGYLAINGQATVGDIVAFNAYVLMLQPPFRQLGMVMMMGQRAAASAQRIYEVLDEQPTVVDRPGAVDLVECRGDVHFDNVSFDYANGTHVLHDFELHLAPGETVALVGRTGTGKSTAARLLARFYDVTDGAVRIDGHDVRDLTLPSLRHQIGMVLDEPFLFSVSIRDNIAYGRPDATMDEVVAAAAAAGADEFIRAMPEGLRHRRRRARVHALGWAAPAHRDRPHARREPTDPGARRRHLGDRRADRAADPRRAERPDGGADDADHRPPAVDDQPRRPGGRGRGRAGHRARAPTPSCSREPRYAEILAQTEEDARRRAEEQEPRAEHEQRRDARTPSTSDVVSSRDLDADIGELADYDPELAPRGGMD